MPLTANHALPPDTALDLAGDAALFLGQNMAVLGAGDAEYDAYEQGIAAEYEPVYGSARFASGRAAFLSVMVQRPRLFLLERYRDRLDTTARVNIDRALRRYAASPV